MYIKLYGYYQPYLEYADYQLAEVGQTQIYLTYLAILIIKQDVLDSKWDRAIEAILIVVNLGVMLWEFYYQTLNYMEENEELKQMVQTKMVEVKLVYEKVRNDNIFDKSTQQNDENPWDGQLESVYDVNDDKPVEFNNESVILDPSVPSGYV